MQLVSHSKHRDVIDILSSMVVTDFGCHTFWVDSEVNYYFVATEEVAMCLAGYGVAREKSVVTGIPLELKFTKSIDRLALCQKFGIDPKRPTLLMVGGQFSFDEMNAIMHEVEQAHPDVQFLAVAGRDEQLKKALDGSDLHSRGNVKTFGFVDNMEEMMSVARLIFTKAGGLTVSECLAKGLPMIINKVIPGQEDDNVQFLTRHGAAIQVKEGESVAQAVIALLSDSSRLEKMRAAAEALGHPKSSVEVANFVAERVGLLSS